MNPAIFYLLLMVNEKQDILPPLSNLMVTENGVPMVTELDSVAMITE